MASYRTITALSNSATLAVIKYLEFHDFCILAFD
jgi:hypothetical protein